MQNSADFIRSFPVYDNSISRPFLIAEAGVNHEGSMDTAKRLIDEAAAGGAQAIKFQSYKADTLAAKNSPAYWDTTQESTTSQYELFKKYDSFWKNEFEALKLYCDEVGIEFLSTPFDLESATYLNDLVHSFKISSSDITNFPFISYIADFGKPIILSTGASYLWEVQQAVDLIDSHNVPLCLMHCVLNYPTPDEHANLGMIKDLKARFPNIVIGYSDHTLPKEMEVLKAAVMLGAVMLEKHFTHDKSLPGNDHYHAMNVADMKVFWQKMDSLFEVLGDFDKKPLATETISRQNARRSLIAQRAIASGETITAEMLTWKRPAFGISPKELNAVVGSVARESIEKDAILYWNMLEQKP